MKDFAYVVVVTMVLGGLLVFASCSDTNEYSHTLMPSKRAIVLFNGRDFSQWRRERGGHVGWEIVNGAMKVVPGTGSIVTKQKFNDFKLHIEFNVSSMPGFEGQRKGNSGVYIQRRYEVQILDSYGIDSGIQDCGAIYKFRAPDKNICKKPGRWQSYDITFHAPRWVGKGIDARKIKNARITVLHNGVVIHNDIEVSNKTGAGRPEGPEADGILLQDHGDQVQFRNIWIVPLD